MLIFLDKASNPSERTLRFMLFILTLKHFIHSSFFSLFSFFMVVDSLQEHYTTMVVLEKHKKNV